MAWTYLALALGALVIGTSARNTTQEVAAAGLADPVRPLINELRSIGNFLIALLFVLMYTSTLI